MSEEYEAAANNFVLAESQRNLETVHYLRTAYCYFKMGEFNKAILFLEKSVSESGNSLDGLAASDAVNEFLDRSEWEKLASRVPELRSQYFTERNVSALLAIRELIGADQAIRRLSSIGNCSSGDLLSLMSRTDENNILKLDEITDKYGWQPEGWLIIWHQRGNLDADNPSLKNIIKKINAAIDSGRENPYFWADFVDFNDYQNGSGQTYGTVIHSAQDSTGKYVQAIYPLKEPELVDSLRESVGLLDLGTYCRLYDILCPEGF